MARRGASTVHQRAAMNTVSLDTDAGQPKSENARLRAEFAALAAQLRAPAGSTTPSELALAVPLRGVDGDAQD